MLRLELREDNITGRGVPIGVRSAISAKVGRCTNHHISDIPRVWKLGSSTLLYYFR